MAFEMNTIISDMEFIAYVVVALSGIPIFMLMRKITKRVQYKRMFRD